MTELRLGWSSTGGQPHGINVMDNVVKECFEEAGIPQGLAEKARPAGAISYECISAKGFLRREIMFVFDLKLPEDFIPTPQDGEVEEFYRWPMSKVLQVRHNLCLFLPSTKLPKHRKHALERDVTCPFLG